MRTDTVKYEDTEQRKKTFLKIGFLVMAAFFCGKMNGLSLSDGNTILYVASMLLMFPIYGLMAMVHIRN